MKLMALAKHRASLGAAPLLPKDVAPSTTQKDDDVDLDDDDDDDDDDENCKGAVKIFGTK
jgi:hypothetical protein